MGQGEGGGSVYPVISDLHSLVRGYEGGVEPFAGLEHGAVLPRDVWRHVLGGDVEKEIKSWLKGVATCRLEEAGSTEDGEIGLRIGGSTLKAIFFCAYCVDRKDLQLPDEMAADVDVLVSSEVAAGAVEGGATERDLRGLGLVSRKVGDRKVGALKVESLRNADNTALRELQECMGLVLESLESSDADQRRAKQVLAAIAENFPFDASDEEIAARQNFLDIETLGLNARLVNGELELRISDPRGILQKDITQNTVKYMMTSGQYNPPFMVENGVNVQSLYLSVIDLVMASDVDFTTYFPQWTLEQVTRGMVNYSEGQLSMDDRLDGSQTVDRLKSVADWVSAQEVAHRSGELHTQDMDGEQLWGEKYPEMYREFKRMMFEDLARSCATSCNSAFRYMIERVPFVGFLSGELDKRFSILQEDDADKVAYEYKLASETMKRFYAATIRAYGLETHDIHVIVNNDLHEQNIIRRTQHDRFPKSMSEVIALFIFVMRNAESGFEGEIEERLAGEICDAWPEGVIGELKYYWRMEDQAGEGVNQRTFEKGVSREAIAEELANFEASNDPPYVEVRDNLKEYSPVSISIV